MRAWTVLLVLVVVWVVSAVLSGWFAARKGRGVRRWAVLGLVLGPFGLLLQAFYPARYLAPGVPCPQCGKTVSTRSVACHHCQYRFPAVDVMINQVPDDADSRRAVLNEVAREYGIPYAEAGRMLGELPVAGYRHVQPDQVAEYVRRLESAGATVTVVPSRTGTASR
jgi:hypothetical protein